MFVLDRTTRQDGKFQRHTIIAQRKVSTAIAFAATIFLICIENAKSFAACGKLAKRLNLCPSKLGVRPILNSGYYRKETIDKGMAATGSSLTHHYRQQLSVSTSLRMIPGVAPSASAPLMLDMKTSINAFGGWYNKLDPVARPSKYYDEDDTDYTFDSPSDSWPTSLDDDKSLSSLNRSRATLEMSDFSPLRAIRRIGSWVFAIRPMQRIRGII